MAGHRGLQLPRFQDTQNNKSGRALSLAAERSAQQPGPLDDIRCHPKVDGRRRCHLSVRRRRQYDEHGLRTRILEIRCDDELQGRQQVHDPVQHLQHHQRVLLRPVLSRPRGSSFGPLGIAVLPRPLVGTDALPMMVHVPSVLTAEQVARCREVMERAGWVDGRVTAGHQSSKVKNNLQLPENSPEARELGAMVVEALARNNLFMSAVLPKQVFPPLFNRYDAGMTFGAHVDNAIRGIPNSGIRIRTDVSSTLFISRPEDYDGGELVVEDTYGAHNVKLPAGDMIVYPATSLHYVTPITRGSRIASFFWTQSMIRDESKRSLLFDMDMAIIKLQRDHPDHVSLVELTSVYHNLLRQWAEL